MNRLGGKAGLVVLWAADVLFAGAVSAATLEVGPGEPFEKIEAALAAAKPGDTILVHPLAEGRPYRQVALMVRTPDLTIGSAPEKSGERVRLDGQGFNYTGAGSMPRAIVQFNREADGCTLEGFELLNARNDSNNGAGVRITSANHVTVRGCDIHDNDMGIMSDGTVAAGTGALQRIEYCRIHANGSRRQTGQSHNLYLAGTSVILRGCEVFGSVSGHNVKSRAHYTRVEYCCVHDSANREFDLVDDRGNTDIPGSDCVLLGNLVVKKSNMEGNKAVIHFGEDGGADHRGTIYFVQNTIITPYEQSPVLDLSAPGVSATLFNNLIWDRGSGRHVLVAVRNSAQLRNVSGRHNLFAPGFSLPYSLQEGQDENIVAPKTGAVTFLNPSKGDWRLLRGEAASHSGESWSGLSELTEWLPAPHERWYLAPDEPAAGPPPLMQYSPPCGVVLRSDQERPTLGAFELPTARD